MRNRIYLLLVLLILGGTSCLAKTEGLSKSSQKSYKKECKRLNKEGWKVFDKSISLDEAMLKHFLEMEASADSILEVIVEGQAKNINTAYSQAKHRASVGQASRISVHIKGQTDVQMSIVSDNSAKTRFRNSTYTHVQQTIKALSPTLSLYRTLKDGTTEINLYYLVK
jgi:hypothetical protein